MFSFTLLPEYFHFPEVLFQVERDSESPLLNQTEERVLNLRHSGEENESLDQDTGKPGAS